MTDIHRLEEYTIDIMESFIENGLEESIHIEFKSNGALLMTDGAKKEISKDVSAFANSDGGIIVYGISEKEHKADSLSFIDGNTFTKEWLEQVISSSIQRNIPDLKIFPIRKDGNIKQSIYVVQIPPSIQAPHICNKDNRFYRRYNFQSVVMEEYEIRALYDRKAKSILNINGYAITQLNNPGDFESFLCECSIRNTGKTIEENYKINAYLLNFPPNSGISWEAQSFNRNHSHMKMEEARFKVSASSICPVYPDEAIDVARFNFQIKRMFLQNAIQNSSIKFVLLYPNGKDELTVFMKDYIII